MSKKIITAQRLIEGDVVFWVDQDRWTTSLSSAALIEPSAVDEALEEAKQSERSNRVITVYAIDVDLDDSGVRPTRRRERIRSVGPTVRPDLTRGQ